MPIHIALREQCTEESSASIHTRLLPGEIDMNGGVHASDFITTLTWVIILTGALLSILGYVRLGGAYYPCSPAGGGLCYSTEYPFDLAAIYAGLLLILGGFAGFAIVSNSSRSKQPNESSARGGPPSFPTSES